MTSIAVPSTQQDHHQQNSSTSSSSSSRSYQNNVVWVNIYDIAYHNDFLLPLLGIGIFHSAIEVYGVEFAFGRSPSGNGVFAIEPQSFPQHVYRESVALGTTNLSEAEIFKLQNQILHKLWPGDGYHIIKRNCNHYSQELGKILLMAENYEMAVGWGEAMIKKINDESLQLQQNSRRRRNGMSFHDIARDRFRSASQWKSIVPATYNWDSEEECQVLPASHAVCDVTYGGSLSLWKVLKHAFFSSTTKTMKLNFENDVYPQWVNRAVRVGERLLSKSVVLAIENGDREAAGMAPLKEEEDEED